MTARTLAFVFLLGCSSKHAAKTLWPQLVAFYEKHDSPPRLEVKRKKTASAA